jgi:predicted nucleotidyltransferase
MRTDAPPLLPILRSQLQGELLAAVLLTDREHSVSELATMLRAPIPTVAREVARLADAGLFASHRVGTARLVSAGRASPLAEPLTELIARSFGPTAVLAREFSSVAGVDRVEIFGSWAARFRGEPGPPPGDVDVLVIGSPDPDDVHDAIDRAERVLRREVNAVVVSADRWKTSKDAFLKHIRSAPRVPVLAADADSGRADELATRPRRRRAASGSS